MEEWEFDFAWLKVRHYVRDQFKREQLPDLNGVLFIIGIQELGRWQNTFTKEEKQDLMHIAVCRLLSYEGYYEFAGRDQDGWPHWRVVKPVPLEGVKAQEILLKKLIIRYFNELEQEHARLLNH